jgi:hypothetical protein
MRDFSGLHAEDWARDHAEGWNARGRELWRDWRTATRLLKDAGGEGLPELDPALLALAEAQEPAAVALTELRISTA